MYALNPGFSPNLRINADKVVYSNLNDHDLIVASQKHDRGAFTALYLRYVRHVRVTVFRLSPDWLNSHDDMVQEAFVRVWKSIDTLKNPMAFKSWLNRLVGNMFYDELRKRPKLSTVSLDQPHSYDDDQECSSRDIPDVRQQPDESFATQELMAQIHGALASLPQQFAKVVALRELDGLSYDEIARITKTSVGTVKSRIARGRTKMQTQLQALIA